MDARSLCGDAGARPGPIPASVPLAAGFLIGGWTGPKIVRRIPAPGLRIMVALAGLALAIKLAFDAYH